MTEENFCSRSLSQLRKLESEQANMMQESLKVYRLVIFLALAVSFVSGVCIHLDLGMENGVIPDSKITASSELNAGTPAKNGRLNYAAGPSWCAQTNDNNPYIQIDLQSLHVICAVSTQGNSKADEWVETYTVQTSTDGVHWTDYDDDGHPKIFIGNTDRNSEEKAILGVLTRWLRIVGKTKHNKFCMRAELFGVKRHPRLCVHLDLGMANGDIPASKITASSKLSPETPAKNGRLNYAAGPSWCAQSNDNNPYLQIDLQSLHVICAVSTQGNSKADEWVETYSIQTSTDGVHWTDYDDDGHPKIFIGNTDRNSEEKAILGVLTRWLRIVGKKKHNKFCMRAELFGVKRHPNNLALKKTAEQSSRQNDSSGAENAVDGNRNPLFDANGNCTLTKTGNFSWWRVDLGTNRVPVSDVFIVNRLFPPSALQTNGYYKITLGDDSNVARNPECNGLVRFRDFIAALVCYRNPLKTGRYVGILTTQGPSILSLCEVEVYSRENLAFKKPTKIIGGHPFWPSRNAVDGDSQRTCIHSNINYFFQNPWWRVDLEQVEPVNEVYIVNRVDCCGDRLNPFEIRVGLASRDNGITNPLCGSGLSVPEGKGVSFFCRPALFGQYVTIRVTKKWKVSMHICEVEVYSARRACQMQAVGITSSLAIPRHRLSASSSRVGFEPGKARLHGSGAWSPSNDGNPNDFLQVDLQYEFFICAVATQGYPWTFRRFWTTKYRLLFSVNGTDWLTYKENGTDKIFNGNSGTEDVVKHSLVSFTRARFVKFQPTEFNNQKALRVEIYGVPVPAGPNKSPSNFNLSPFNSTSVSASWKLPSAGSIQGIKLLYKTKNSQNPFTTSTIVSDSITSTSVTGLGKFTEYEFHVLAFTANGNGPLSPVQVVRTNEDVPSEGPKGISFDYVGQTTYNISWAPLAREKRNGIITEYEIKREKASTGARSKRSTGDITYSKSENTFAVVSGFQPGCKYKMSVRAFTTIGPGPFGEEKTLESSVPPYWEVKTIRQTELEFTWINPSLPTTEVSNYTFTYSGTKNDSVSVSLGSPPSERHTVTNLEPNTIYKFYFDGISSCGQSLSQIIEAKTTPIGGRGASQENSVTAVAIAVPVVLIILLVVLAILGVLFYRRRNNKKSSRGNDRVHFDVRSSSTSNSAAPLDANTYENPEDFKTTNGPDRSHKPPKEIYQNSNVSAPVEQADLVYQNIARKQKGQGQSPIKEVAPQEEPVYEETNDGDPKAIPVDKFAEYFKSKSRDGGILLREEFKKLSGGMLASWKVAQACKSKNRYGNIASYDHSRVILEEIKGKSVSDYINASYIPTYDEETMCYIATQGPTSVTVSDFWRMIWQEKCSVIVMLTNLVEQGKQKCEQYWPNDISEYGGIKVTLLKTENFANYVIRSFFVIKGSEKRDLFQFHYTTWPDRGVPQNSTALLAFRWKVYARQQLTEGPLVVHCSAGVGRTGTYIGIDAMLECAKDRDNVFIQNYVEVMRRQRPYMVQKEEQYVFLHEAVMVGLACGNTEVSSEDLLLRMNKLARVNKSSNQTGYQEEFQRLQRICKFESQGAPSTAALKPSNRTKNRYINYIPVDTARVILTSSQEDRDYINASFVDGNVQRDAYILTQAPLSNTTEDFWRMVSQYDVSTVVMLNDLRKESESYPQYWPSEGVVKYGDITLKILAKKKTETSTITKLSVLDAVPPKKTSTVQHLQFTGWSHPNSPPDPQEILELVTDIEKSQQNTGNGIIVLQCSDGVGRSATVAAIMSAIEKVKTEQTVDIFQTIKLLRVKRPSAVTTLEQYRLCYSTISAFLDSFETYANFA
ncbi:receptor-type tyrosine-protein phosphatase mu-like isoform X3 [Acropora millepora]|uniref:receptor-type tyrosine-protein phosphatase mu-like isoform X3 n=1 Tax=Acropora millepora TaxID=45264 RepID=UPI001CF5D240|nr:receptor-type tyrosine-protein phosphatase mu-like isoform X3 [Acropora millepora]